MVLIKLNGTPTSIPAVLVEGRTYVRLRDLAGALGAEVIWEEGERAANVITVLRPHLELDLRLPSAGREPLDPRLLDQALAGTGLAGLGERFAAAEGLYRGPNALMAAAHAALESAWGTSRLAREKKNLFGIGAYDRDPGQARTFSSFEECIDWYASFVTREYLHPRGKYYARPTLGGMNRHWATDPRWGEKIVHIAIKMLSRMGFTGI